MKFHTSCLQNLLHNIVQLAKQTLLIAQHRILSDRARQKGYMDRKQAKEIPERKALLPYL